MKSVADAFLPSTLTSGRKRTRLPARRAVRRAPLREAAYDASSMMNRGVACCAVVVGLLVATAAGTCAAFAPALASIGFGVSVPYELPVDWAASFSYVSVEALLSPHLTVYLDLGTYPAAFPDVFEVSASLLVKGWVGPTDVFGGAGFTTQWTRVGPVWSIRPLWNLRAGYQIWLAEAAAIQLQFRTLEPIFLDQWTFSPEIALGFCVGLGRARPASPRFDLDVLWLLVGLGVAALLAFLPRQ